MRRYFVIFVTLIFATAIAFGEMPPAKWAKFEGNKIRYFETGNRKSDKAFILIHGWTCNAEFWRYSINAFPEYRVIAVDLPGHGGSDKPE